LNSCPFDTRLTVGSQPQGGSTAQDEPVRRASGGPSSAAAYRSDPPQDAGAVESADADSWGRTAAPSIERAGQGGDALRASIRRRPATAEVVPIDTARLVRLAGVSVAVSSLIAAGMWWWIRWVAV
jgi:hypothetical protein